MVKRSKKDLTSQQAIAMARRMYELGKYEKANGYFRLAVQGRRFPSRWYLELAMCEERLGRGPAAVDAVIHFARRAIKKNSLDRAYDAVEKYLTPSSELRQVFFKAILDVDHSAHPFLGLARAYLQQKKWFRAEQVLVNALRARNRELVIIDYLKEALRSQGKAEAIEVVKRYEKGAIPRVELVELLEQDLNPRCVELKEGGRQETLTDLIEHLEVELGGAKEEGVTQELRAEIERFRQGVAAIIKDDPKSRMDLALAFFEMGLFVEAEDELAQISKTAVCYFEAQCLLGEILCRQGKDLMALGVYQRCLREERITEAVHVDATYKLVEIYYRLGDIDQARELAEELAIKEPYYRDLKALRRELEERRETGT